MGHKVNTAEDCCVGDASRALSLIHGCQKYKIMFTAAAQAQCSGVMIVHDSNHSSFTNGMLSSTVTHYV